MMGKGCDATKAHYCVNCGTHLEVVGNLRIPTGTFVLLVQSPRRPVRRGLLGMVRRRRRVASRRPGTGRRWTVMTTITTMLLTTAIMTITTSTTTTAMVMMALLLLLLLLRLRLWLLLVVLRRHTESIPMVEQVRANFYVRFHILVVFTGQITTAAGRWFPAPTVDHRSVCTCTFNIVAVAAATAAAIQSI